ncbi:MAG: DNA-3-methyladenine glycosylase [Actinomycetes bacterium]
MPAGLRQLGRPRPFPRRRLVGDAPAVAHDLLGALVVRAEPDGSETVVRLVEVEAYRQDDPASHTFRGETPGNATMFGEAGHLYVYFTYGMHHCANVVAGRAGEGAAVLLRAGVVLAGDAHVDARRPRARRPVERTGGPGRLAQALALDRTHDGVDLCDPTSPVRLATDGFAPAAGAVVAGPRVGVRLAADTPWRFHLAGVAEVSRYARHPRA